MFWHNKYLNNLLLARTRDEKSREDFTPCASFTNYASLKADLSKSLVFESRKNQTGKSSTIEKAEGRKKRVEN